MQNEDKKESTRNFRCFIGLLAYWFTGLLVCWVIVVEKKKKKKNRKKKKNWTLNIVNYIVLYLFSP